MTRRDPASIPLKNRAGQIGADLFTPAGDLRNQRAMLKRTLTTIVKTRQALRDALTPDESAALETAAIVLHRLMDATHSAFLTKRAAEEAAQKRREGRAREARAWILARWAPATPREHIFLTVAIAHARAGRSGYSSFEPSHVTSEMQILEQRKARYGETNVAAAFQNWLRSELETQIRDVVDRVSWDSRPIGELLIHFETEVAAARPAANDVWTKLCDDVEVYLVKHRLQEANGKDG